MRMAYLMCCVVVGGLVGAKLATAERPLDSRAPQEPAAAQPRVADGGAALCPLWPIWDYGEEIYMFYAERFEEYDCDYPQAALFTGYAPDWPYLCPDCLLAARAASEKVGETGGNQSFRGLEAKVSADFRPAFPEKLNANAGVAFESAEFVEFTVPGTQSVHRAKLFRVTLERAAASPRKAARTIGLGYEVANQPAPTLDASAATVTAVDGSTHAYNVLIGGMHYLVLLAR